MRCTLAELDHPNSLLNRAAEQAAQADPFSCRTEWQFSFHEAFSPRRPLHFRKSGGSLIAFAQRHHPQAGVILEPIESHWRFGCPLLGPDAVALLASLLCEEPHLRHPPVVLVSGLFPGSPLLRRIAKAFETRFEIVRLRPTVFRSASLDGGIDGYLSRRSSTLRHNLRRAGRRAADEGVTFERWTPHCEADAEAVYARMLRVEEVSWKGIGRCGMAEQPARDFYRLMLRRLARSSSGRVMFARRDEQDIGFIFGAMAGRNYRGQQFSYAEDWRSFSIGNLLQREQIRWLCEEGIARYDMGPLMDYKLHWTELELRTEARLLRPRREAAPSPASTIAAGGSP